MRPHKSTRRKIVKDLTRTRHMTAVSAVILGTTFMPLLGLPEMHELRTFQRAVEGFSDARAHAFEPRRNDEAARERSANAVSDDRARDRATRSTRRGYHTLSVERPDREPVDVIELEIPPLPAAENVELLAPVKEETMPETIEAEPQAERTQPEQQEDEAAAPEDQELDDLEDTQEQPPLEEERA